MFPIPLPSWFERNNETISESLALMVSSLLSEKRRTAGVIRDLRKQLELKEQTLQSEQKSNERNRKRIIELTGELAKKNRKKTK